MDQLSAPATPDVRLAETPSNELAVSRRPWMRRRLLVAVLFGVLAFIELWAPITKGGWFVPSDIGQLWSLTRIPGEPLAPHNTLESDVYVQLAPFMHFTSQSVRSGSLPVWNPIDGNGQPFLANGQSVVFSPFSAFFYVLSFRLALLAAALARLWMLGFLTYLFLARNGLRDLSAVVGGTIFAFAGYHIVWLDYQTIVSVSAFLPLALWCAAVALGVRSRPPPPLWRRYLALGGLAVGVGAMILGGNPETAIFDLIMVAAYSLVLIAFSPRRWLQRALRACELAAAAVVGIGVSAAGLFPFLAYEHISSTAAKLAAHPSMVIPGFSANTAPLVAFPNLFGGPQFAHEDAAFYTWLHPPTNYAELGGNAIGLAAVCLGVLGLVSLLSRRQKALSLFGLGAAVVGTLLLYSRGVGVIWTHIPGLANAHLNRSQDVELMGVAVLAALGVDWVLARAKRPVAVGKTVAVVLVVFGVVIAAAIFGAELLRRHVPGTSAVPAGFVHRQLVLEGLIALLGAGALVVLAGASKRGLLSMVAGGGLAFSGFASNGLIMRSYNTTTGTWAAYQRTPTIAKLQSVTKGKEALFMGGTFAPPETGLWFGIDEVGSYDSLGLRWHDDLYRAVFHTGPIPENMPACIEGLRLFGVKLVVGGDGRFASGPGLDRAGEIRSVPYYVVPGASEYSLVGRQIVAQGDAKSTALVSSCSFDPDSTVVIDPASYKPDDQAPLSGALGPAHLGGRISVSSTSATARRLAVISASSGWLVIRQSWAPGWQATLDGKEVAIRRADVAFQAVRVPAGRSTVVLTYHAPYLETGEILSLCALGAIALGVLVVLVGPRLLGSRGASEDLSQDPLPGRRSAHR
ncbi:MAG: YfhO family protein [Acidimicrobiales bacterium]